MNHFILSGLLALGLSLLPQLAKAQAASCTTSVTPLAFGNYVPSQAGDVDTTSTIRVDCSSGLPQAIAYSIALSTGSSGSYANRTLGMGTDRLNYNLYTDANRSTVWGDGSGGTLVVAGALALPAQASATQPVYGRLPGLQLVRPGSFADLLMVTVTY